MSPFRTLAVMGALLAGTSGWAAMDCSSLLGKKVVTIDDILQVRNNSRLKDNFKLQMAGLYQIIEHHYGPLNLKPATTNLNWDQLKRDTLKLGSKLETSNDQYYALANFMARFNDAHISVQLPSSLSWRLPLQIHTAEGRHFVGFVSDQFPQGIQKPRIGDELVAINGMKPEDFQKQFPQFNASGNDLTNKTMFGFQLARWSESSGLPLSVLNWKDLELTFAPKEKPNETYSAKIPFVTEGTGLIGKDMDGRDPNPAVVFSLNPSSEPDASADLAPKTTSILRQAHALMRTEAPGIKRRFGNQTRESGQGQRMEIGGRRPFFKLPDNFREITIPAEALLDPKFKNFFSADSFFAGTFERNGKKVGFLRVPSYGATTVGAVGTTIRYFIGKLQAESDYLIIDQTNNPGGMVIKSDMLIKALVGEYKSDRHMRFAVKPSQKFLRQYWEMRNDVAKNEDQLFTQEEVNEIVRKLDAEYNKIFKAYSEGKDLSEPISMLAISEYAERSFDRALFKLPWGSIFEAMTGVNIQKPQTYTKPIFFMINELDFSGGDATPAIFQDYGRGFLIGTREETQTGGAGGTVENFTIRGAQEVGLSLTTSLMVRFNGHLVENYGVKADYNVPLTREDIANGQSQYFNRILELTDKLIQK